MNQQYTGYDEQDQDTPGHGRGQNNKSTTGFGEDVHESSFLFPLLVICDDTKTEHLLCLQSVHGFAGFSL